MTAIFPFGAPSQQRPMRSPVSGAGETFVLGVYPSALHVKWQLPAWALERGWGHGVTALAVDVEPTVFWDGLSPSADQLVDHWAAKRFETGDEVGQHGKVESAGRLNGSSGVAVENEVLRPLGLRLDDVW